MRNAGGKQRPAPCLVQAKDFMQKVVGLPPKATSRDWWVRDPDTLNLWDWAPWSFSMGFYANIGALFWATATLSVAALAVGWCGCLRFCAPEHEAKPNAVPTVVSESKDAP